MTKGPGLVPGRRRPPGRGQRAPGLQGDVLAFLGPPAHRSPGQVMTRPWPCSGPSATAWARPTCSRPQGHVLAFLRTNAPKPWPSMRGPRPCSGPSATAWERPTRSWPTGTSSLFGLPTPKPWASYQQARALFRAVGDRLGEANALSGLGHMARMKTEG